MIEVAVAIAVIAILAGAAAPLALKALNQQREQKTRENLKIAWEALFGSRDRRVANLRADFGFNPAATLTDLRSMTTRTPASLRGYGPDPGTGGLPWGWNGPYWTGPVQPAAGTQGLPLDAWGRPFRLEYGGAANPTWRLRSLGPNGVLGGTQADDLFYPETAAPVAGYVAILTVNVARTNPASTTTSLPVTVRVTDRLNGSPHYPAPVPAATFPLSMNLLDKQSWTYQVTPGAVRIEVNTNGEIVDLLPGEFRALSFQFD